MSEWEQFKAYQGIIVDAKREERERIIKLLENHKNYLWKATESGQVDVVPNVEMFERMMKLIGKEDDATNTD